MMRSSHYSRVAKAMGTLLFLVLMCVLFDYFFGSKQLPAQKVSGNIAGAVLVENQSFESVIEQYPDSLFADFKNEPSGAFVEECLDLSGCENVYVSKDERSLCFTMPQDPTDAFFRIKDFLGEKGWMCIESGVRCKASFVKETGLLHWLFVETYSINAGSMVLITKEEGDDEE